MKEKLPKALKEYYDRVFLRAVEEDMEEEKRLGRKLTQDDRVRMMIGKALRRAALTEAFKEI